MKLHNIMIGIAIVLFIAIPIWIYLIVPQLEKMPKDYNSVLDYIRTSNTNHEIGGEWAGEKLISGVSNYNTVKIDGNVQIIQGSYKAKELDNSIVWEVNRDYEINRNTKVIISNTNQYSDKDYFLFPNKIEKKTYRVWFTQYLYPIELEFKSVENLNGLEVFNFEAKNFIFDDSEGFNYLDLVPETYKILADGTVNVWVEPISGKIINFKGGGVAYYADPESKEKIQDMQTWSNEYNKDTIANQVRLAQNEKQRIFLIEIITPILLALIGIALIFASIIGRKYSGEQKPVKEIKPIIPKK